VINSINVGRREPVSLRGVGGGKGGPSGMAAATMQQAASRVATTLASELRLADIDPREGYAGGSSSDAYGVEEMAAALSDALGGTPADRGHVARALHDFVREGAALMAARPESRSIEKLVAAIDAEPGGHSGTDLQQAIATIDAAAARLTDQGR
jgi:hypothetical protein